jgi:hypothetical protein
VYGWSTKLKFRHYFQNILTPAYDAVYTQPNKQQFCNFITSNSSKTEKVLVERPRGVFRSSNMSAREQLERERIGTQRPVQEEALVAEILKAINSIRYGAVHLILQDGRVVQIEKTEKVRLV